MKFTLSWLAEHLAAQAPRERIIDTLSAIGLEVEGIEDRGAALAPFRIARVIEAAPHPNADRLRACRVDIGAAEPVPVVCGAPNCRTGMRAVFAPPGATIPGTGQMLKSGEIRGLTSAGMLLSAREMGIGEGHEGIVELPEDAPVGALYAAWAGLDEVVVEIAVTPNRGDALGVRGIARDLAAAGLGALRPWSAPVLAGQFSSPIRWAIAAPAACPWVLGRTIRGLRNGPSPEWLARRLTAIGLRPINALVDITNYFTFDLGRPLHVFDADRISGDTLTIAAARGGERLRALNGRDYTLAAGDTVIADAAGVQSLAGIMGGAATGSEAETTSVFVECALFDPVAIAVTGRRHQITSDARQRFERGVDPALPPAALQAATRMILDLCGGEASEVVSAGAEPAWQREAALRFARLAEFGGADVPPDAAVAILERLGFAATSRDDRAVTVTVPPWRNDIAGRGALDQSPDLDPDRAASARAGAAAMEPECDLIEEVLRIRGLDTIAAVPLPAETAQATPVPGPSLTPRQARDALARRCLAAQGYLECVTFSFMAAAEAALFGPAPAALRLQNPIAADLDQLRPTPLATLAGAAARNAVRGYPDLALFEIGPGFAEAGQSLCAAALRTGHTPRHWSAPARPLSVFDAKADLWAALTTLGVPIDALSVTADAPPHYHPGQSGVVRQGPKLILARFGALHPGLLARIGIDGPAVGFEIALDALADPRRRRRSPPDLPDLQPIRRDFAFVVARELPAEALLRAVRGADRKLISAVSLFDVYEGPGLGEAMKSLGVEVVIQPRDHTLTEPELEALAQKVVTAAENTTGARLR